MLGVGGNGEVGEGGIVWGGGGIIEIRIGMQLTFFKHVSKKFWRIFSIHILFRGFLILTLSPIKHNTVHYEDYL